MKNKLSINLEVSLVEIIMSVLIFAIAGVIMINCFAYARFTQVKANDKVTAVFLVQSNVEMIKASETVNVAEQFLSENSTLVDDSSKKKSYIKYYDKDWNLCSEDKNEYSMKITISNENLDYGHMMDVSITVEKSKMYPFIDKGSNSNAVFSVETMKFFPDIESGRQ